VNLEWLTDKLVAALLWRLDNPDADDRDGPEIAPAGHRLWRIFCALHAARGGGFGPNPISYSEIDAWARLHREPVRPFEVNILGAMDRAYLEHVAESRPQADGKRPVQSSRPMTPELFDALF
jgi:hypothetical protein